MDEYEFGPKYPPGEFVFVEERGWGIVQITRWEDEWIYIIKFKSGEEIEVKEWQILL